MEDWMDGLLAHYDSKGVVAGRGDFERVVAGLSALFSSLGQLDVPQVLRSPPVIPRRILERAGYFESFPQFVGSVSCFPDATSIDRVRHSVDGTAPDWSMSQVSTDLVLLPAACYSVYPQLERLAAIPPGGLAFDVLAYCFRREPSDEVTRLQSFRMHEQVCVGSELQAVRFRKTWMVRVLTLMGRLCVPYSIELASDPFFGTAGRILAAEQREHALKYEVVIPISEGRAPTACISLNYHRDHFGRAWNLQTAPGECAHSACVAVGLERLALALFRFHGELCEWPAHVREFVQGAPQVQ